MDINIDLNMDKYGYKYLILKIQNKKDKEKAILEL